MKKQKRLLLFIITLLMIFSCGNSTKSNTNEEASGSAQTDDYASLRETGNTTQGIVEDLSGKVIIITEDEFIERITELDNPKGFQYLGRTPCIVLLYADWCKPCGYQTQLMREIAPEYQGRVIFYRLNVDKAQHLKYVFNVESIPMILYFKPHHKISTTVGYLNRENFKKTIDDILLNS